MIDFGSSNMVFFLTFTIQGTGLDYVITPHSVILVSLLFVLTCFLLAVSDLLRDHKALFLY
jgi:hypothetical protein